MIGGEGVIVKIVETKMSKRKYHNDHQAEGVWLVGGVAKTAGKKLRISRKYV